MLLDEGFFKSDYSFEEHIPKFGHLMEEAFLFFIKKFSLRRGSL